MFGSDGFYIFGVECIIKGISKWLRDKMGSGGEKNDYWLVLDFFLLLMFSDVGSMVIFVYDIWGYLFCEGFFDRFLVVVDVGIC